MVIRRLFYALNKSISCCALLQLNKNNNNNEKNLILWTKINFYLKWIQCKWNNFTELELNLQNAENFLNCQMFLWKDQLNFQ